MQRSFFLVSALFCSIACGLGIYSVTDPLDDAFSDFSYLSTVTANGVTTTAVIGEYNCSSSRGANSDAVLMGVGCAPGRSIFIGCGEQAIESVLVLDANGVNKLGVSGEAVPPFENGFAMAVDMEPYLWMVDQPSERILRLTLWNTQNKTDVSSCLFPLAQPLHFIEDQIDQIARSAVGDEAFYVLGNVPNSLEFVVVALNRSFDMGGACMGWELPLQFVNFPEDPFPVQGFSYNGKKNVLYLPVVFDWQYTLLAEIDVHTGVALPVPHFKLVQPATLYSAGYDNATATYTMAITSDWPAWTYQTWDIVEERITAVAPIAVANENFYIRAVCIY